MSAELRPCPFCQLIPLRIEGTSTWLSHSCAGVADIETQEAKWNTRPLESSLQSLLTESERRRDSAETALAKLQKNFAAFESSRTRILLERNRYEKALKEIAALDLDKSHVIYWVDEELMECRAGEIAQKALHPTGTGEEGGSRE